MNPLQPKEIFHVTKAKNFDTKQKKVTVSFESNPVMKENITAAFKNFKNPEIILWFLGRKGCRQPWADFLCNDFIAPIRKLDIGANFHLCDLSSWDDFKSLKEDPLKPKNSKVISKINNLKCQDIRVIQSSDFFKYLKEGTNQTQLKYVEDTIWKRDWIWEESKKNFTSSGKALKNLGPNYAYLNTIQEIDCSLAYSALQYLEGAYYIEHVIANLSSGDKDIVFFLPNDECKYYKDSHSDFETDLTALLETSPYFKTHDCLRVHFIPFVWGTDKSDRPYLSGASTAKLQTFESLKLSKM